MSELTNWRVEKLPHKYDDGTKFRYAVLADGRDYTGEKLNVMLADWLTEDSARLIAAAPDMLAALKACHDLFALIAERKPVHSSKMLKAHDAVVAAMFKAEP